VGWGGGLYLCEAVSVNHLAVLKSLAVLGRLHSYLMLWDKRMIL
jgi:hypothetical protein